jgi:phospholipase D1/2
VIVDAPALGNARRLIAFIGGLDLCDGRYDTPKHTLFKNLNTTFADDYHNPTFATVSLEKKPNEKFEYMESIIYGIFILLKFLKSFYVSVHIDS